MTDRLPPRRCWTWAHRATAGGFFLLLVLGSFDWFPWIKGSMTATRLGGLVRLADPLATIEVTLATRSVEASLLLAAGLLVILCVFLGRVFCGWICPLGLVLDLNDALRTHLARVLGRMQLRLPAVRLPSKTKYFLLGLVLGLSLIARLPAFQLVSPINFLTWGAIYTSGPEWLLLAGIVVLELFSARLWCRALCPLGALYSLIGQFALLRVRINSAQTGKLLCRRCTIRCPMGIRVMEDYALAGKGAVDDPECTRCGSCVDVCPQEALKLAMRNIAPTTATTGGTGSASDPETN